MSCAQGHKTALLASQAVPSPHGSKGELAGELRKITAKPAFRKRNSHAFGGIFLPSVSPKIKRPCSVISCVIGRTFRLSCSCCLCTQKPLIDGEIQAAVFAAALASLHAASCSGKLFRVFSHM
jgi:hypothetical protein